MREREFVDKRHFAFVSAWPGCASDYARTMDIAERARELLGRPGPDSSRLLWQLARDAAADGMTQGQLEAVFQDLRDEASEADEDRLLDILDCIVGWCHPDARIFS